MYICKGRGMLGRGHRSFCFSFSCLVLVHNSEEKKTQADQERSPMHKKFQPPPQKKLKHFQDPSIGDSLMSNQLSNYQLGKPTGATPTIQQSNSYFNSKKCSLWIKVSGSSNSSNIYVYLYNNNNVTIYINMEDESLNL